MLAEQSMVLVIEGCKSVINRADISSHERANFSVSVATLYASPFTEGRQLGGLDEKYEAFADTSLKQTHEATLVYRHCFAAHRDLSNLEVKVHAGDKSAHFYTPIFTIKDKGEITRHVPFMSFENSQFQRIQDLAEFQLKRIKAKADKLAGELIQSSQLKMPGEYILGQTYP